MELTPTRIVTPQTVRGIYKGFVLENGVKCVIIQNEEAKVPTASMTVCTGQLCDPVQLPGLAHFCEHMLFMGTEKYPNEDEFQSYLSKNGGSSNAFTADRFTTYFFQVSDEALTGALERFLEFFVAPTFNSSAVDRELQAVHSEDEKNHSIDYWRTDEVFRLIVNQHHPMHRYGNGNITTLRDIPKANGIDVREELVKFYNSNYFASNSCIVVCSIHTPEVILKTIRPTLERMRQGTPPRFSFTQAVQSFIDPAYVGTWVNIRTVKKERSVKLQWAARSPMSRWRSMPFAYASHVLGHECDCSVLGVLKREGFATAMVAGPRRIDEDYEVLYVEISLTAKGMMQVMEVIRILYEAIGQMKSVGAVDEEVYAQMKAETALSFESTQIDSFTSHCTDLSSTACECSLEECFVGGSKILEDDKQTAFEYLNFLDPRNCVVSFLWYDMPTEDATETSPNGNVVEAEQNDEENECGSEHGDDEEGAEPEAEVSSELLFQSLPSFAQKKTDRVSQFHKTQFSVTQIPEEIKAEWMNVMSKSEFYPGLALPPTNPFLATDFTIFAPLDSPTQSSGVQRSAELFTSAHGSVSMRKDVGIYRSFQSAVAITTMSPTCYASPLHRFFTRVMMLLLQHVVTEVSYFGELASLENVFTLSTGGLSLNVQGPLQSLPTFFQTLARHMFSRESLCASKDLYDTYAEVAVRKLEGMRTKQPYEQALVRIAQCRAVVLYTFEDIIPVAQAATYADYLQFVESYLSSGTLYECSAAGNMESTEIFKSAIVDKLESALKNELGVPPADKSAFLRFRDVYDALPSVHGVELSKEAVCAYDYLEVPSLNPSDPNTAVLLDICVGAETAVVRAHLSCINGLISSAFFNALRTKETLGYIVFSRPTRQEGVASMQFCAQSAVNGVDGVYLLSRIHAFLEAVEVHLDTICADDEVAVAVRSQIALLEQKPTSVGVDCAELHAELTHPLGQNRKVAVIEELRKITPASLKQFFVEKLSNGSSTRAALAVAICSHTVLGSATVKDRTSVNVETVALPSKLKQESNTEGGESVEPTESSSAAAAAAEGTGAVEFSLPDYNQTRPSVTLKRLISPKDTHTGCAVIRSTTF